MTLQAGPLCTTVIATEAMLSMARLPISASTGGFLLLLAILTPTLPPLPVLSADFIYKYVDDAGTVNFTDHWQSIPESYRGRAQAIDPTTGKPATAPPRTGQTGDPAPPPDRLPEAAKGAGQSRAAPSLLAGWLNTFSSLSIPLPSRYQFGVGLTTLVLLWGAFKIMRLISNPVLKMLLKASMVFLLAGSVYAMFLSGLNERIAEETGEPDRQTLTGQDLMDNAGELKGRVTEAVEKAEAPIKKLEDATVGETTRTVNKANQATGQEEKVLQQIESSP